MQRVTTQKRLLEGIPEASINLCVVHKQRWNMAVDDHRCAYILWIGLFCLPVAVVRHRE